MSVVSISYLLESGAHFGHQKRRWNPKMKEYIFTSRDDIYIIDLQKTVKKIDEAYQEVLRIANNGGSFLFVGTRKQANEAMVEAATRVDMHYVTKRWLGGTLTNFKTIKNRIKRLDVIETMEKDGTFELLPKKEVLNIKKEYDKLNDNLCGIRNMKKVPECMIIVDPTQEDIAIKEAKILGIPVIGIVDTNCDPDKVDFVIPANDDSIRSIKVIMNVLANAIAEVNGKETMNFLTDEDKAKNEKRKQRELEKAGAMPLTAEKTIANEEEKTAPEKEIKEEVNEEIKEEVTEESTDNLADINTLNLVELKERAKLKGIKGYSKLKKEELLEILK